MARMKTKKWYGVVVDVRTYAQLKELQSNLDARTKATGARRIVVRLAQGCYHRGVSASAGTHDLAGCVDISVHNPRALTEAEIDLVVFEARRIGLWAWFRRTPEWHTTPDGWHIHANSVGCPDFTTIASNQVAAARKGYNGLGHLGLGGKDRHADMHLPVIKWEDYLADKAKAAAKTAGKHAAPKPPSKAKKVIAAGSVVVAVGTGGAAVTHSPAPAPKAVSVAPRPSPKPVVVKPAAKAVKATALHSDVRPGKHAEQVRDIKAVLVKAGFGKSVHGRTDFYSAAVERAVLAFHEAHPQFASHNGDTRLGPKGWAYLQHLAGRV